MIYRITFLYIICCTISADYSVTNGHKKELKAVLSILNQLEETSAVIKKNGKKDTHKTAQEIFIQRVSAIRDEMAMLEERLKSASKPKDKENIMQAHEFLYVEICVLDRAIHNHENFSLNQAKKFIQKLRSLDLLLEFKPLIYQLDDIEKHKKLIEESKDSYKNHTKEYQNAIMRLTNEEQKIQQEIDTMIQKNS